MSAFPKGLKVLCVDSGEDVAAALRHPELAYCVTAVSSLEAAQACFAGGAAAFDCLLVEHSLLVAAGRAEAEALFDAAAVGQAPVVLMGEAPSQSDVLEGIQLGAADYLERPLSFHKIRTLWQHKIRRMMASANGGMLPRLSSSSHLADPTAALAWCTSGAALPHVSSCPPTPAHFSAIAAPRPESSSSLGSGDSASHLASQALAVSGSSRAAEHSSDATSGSGPAQLLPLQRAGQTVSPAAPPLACLRNGAGCREALPPAAVQWPALPSGSTWGTPVGCGVVPPPMPTDRVPAAVASAPILTPVQHLAIKWCPPGSLPLPASTYDLLLPHDFNLMRPTNGAAATNTSGRCRGPLGLRLTVTPDLLSDIDAALRGPKPAPVPSGPQPYTFA